MTEQQSKQEKLIERLSWGATILVLFIAVIGFVLSYAALQNVAYSNGVPFYLSVLWPLLIDLAVIVFSIAIFRASLLSEKTWWPWVLVVLFSAFTVTFNLLHAGDDLINIGILEKYFVFVVPPVALVLAFETFIAMIKSGVRRHWLVQSSVELRQTYDNLGKERDKLGGQIDRLTGQVENLERQISDKKAELVKAGQRPVVIIGDTDPTELGNAPDKRRPLVAQMIEAKMTEVEICQTFGIHERTLKRDIQALNGKIKVS